MIIKAINEARAEIGDSVLVVISSGTFLKASALIYLMPVVALILGGVLGKFIAPAIGTRMSAEIVSAVFGFASLVLSFIIVKLVSKKIGESEANLARIIKVLNV